VTVAPPSTELLESTTLDIAATAVVAAVVELEQPEAATHTRNNAAPKRTMTDRSHWKLTSMHRRGKSRPYCDRMMTRAWQNREDSST